MKERIKVLDFLRGIAILLVMLRHTNLSAVTTQMGWIGVDLFFVLSGFLVSGLLFAEFKKNGTISPIRFLIRRGFKIYPLFYTVLLLHMLYFYLKELPIKSSEILPEIFFYQNYTPGIIGISWSLAIEEHFYILLSILLFVLYKKRAIKERLMIPVACLLVAVICLILRIISWQNDPQFDPYTHFFPTHLRIDSLAFGVLIAWLYHFHSEWLKLLVRHYRYVLLIVIPLFLLPAFIYTAESREMTTFGFTFLYLGFGILLALFVVYADSITQSFYRLKADFLLNSIAWTGVYSYAIYLLHMKAGPIISSYIDSKITDIPPLIIILLNFAFNIVCGYLLSLLVEKPFLRLREKYYPAR